MCGIVGVILSKDSGFIKKTEDSFFEMLYVDALRGFDSTGVIAVEKTGAYSIAKEASAPTFFIPSFRDHQVCKTMWNVGRAYIGHNRKKTMGAISDETAHPFVIDNTFAMVHNGTLHNHKALADTDIDSQALAIVLKKALEADNVKEVLEETLGKVFGAYAVVIYDQKKEHIHFLRNKDRPLWLVHTEDGTFFASEGAMAGWILNRNGYAYDKIKLEALPEETLVSFNLLDGKRSDMELTPKKSTPLTITTTTPAYLGASSLGGVVSGTKTNKQAFKFFKKKYLNERISFWVDDYIEENFPKTIDKDGETEVLLFARSDDIRQIHTITAYANLKKAGFSTSEEIFEQRWSGIITEIDHHEATGSVSLLLSEAKPLLKVVSPLVAAKESADDVKKQQFKDSLVPKSIATLKSELFKFEVHLAVWQQDMYREAIAQRQDELRKLLEQSFDTDDKQSYDDCFAAAAIENVKLVETRIGDKIILRHPTKGVVYEGTIAVH